MMGTKSRWISLSPRVTVSVAVDSAADSGAVEAEVAGAAAVDLVAEVVAEDLEVCDLLGHVFRAHWVCPLALESSTEAPANSGAARDESGTLRPAQIGIQECITAVGFVQTWLCFLITS